MRQIAALLCLLPFLALPAAAQEDDRGFLVSFLEDSLSEAGRDVRIEGFRGALSSRARIDRMTIADDDGVWITLHDVTLHWNRAAVVRRRIEINELSAAEIVLTRLPETEDAAPTPEATPFSLPELPVAVQVGALNLPSVQLGADVAGMPLHFSVEGAANLAGGAGATRLELVRRDGPEGRFSLAAGFDNETRQLEIDLELAEAAGGLAAGALGVPGEPPVTLSVAGEGPLSDFGADLRLATDGTERLRGAVTLFADPGAREGGFTQRFRADLSGDMAPLLAPQYHDFFGEELELRTEGAQHPDGRFELSDLSLKTRAMNVSGRLILGEDGLPDLMDLHLDIAAPEAAPVTLPVAGPPTRIYGAQLRLQHDSESGEDWRITGAVANLEREGLRIGTLILSGDGRIIRDGERGVDGQLTFNAGGIAPEDPALARAIGSAVSGELRAGWREGAPVSIDAFNLQGADYGLSGTARIAGADISGDISARLDDLTRFQDIAGQPVSGAAWGSVSGEAGLLAGSFDLDIGLTGQNLAVGVDELDGLLRGRSTIAGSVRRDEAGLWLRDLNVDAATLSATASGILRSTGPDIEAELDFSDLSVLGAEYGGALRAQAHLRGDAEAQRVTLTGEGRDLAAGQQELDNLLRGPSQLRLDATRRGDVIALERFELSAATLLVGAEGRVEQGASDLRAKLDFGDLSALGAGYGGAFEAQAELREDGARRFVSVQGAARDLRVGQAEADTLLAGTTQLDLDATEEEGRIRVNSFNLRNPNLTASAEASIDGASRQIDLETRLADLGVLVPGFPGPVTLSGRVTESEAGYGVDVSGTGPGGIDFRVAGRAAHDFDTNLVITGGAQLGLANRFLEPVSVFGPLRFDLRMRGQPGIDALSGTVTTENARVVSPRENVTLDNVSATATLGGGMIGIESRADVGAGGSVRASGQIAMAPPNRANLTVVLDEARQLDPNLYDTRVSGNVSIDGPITGGGRISGALRLSETRLRIPSTGIGGPGYIPRVIHHLHEPPEVLQTRRRAGLVDPEGNDRPRRPFDLDLSISAPNRIFLRGRGLDAELGGRLEIGGTTQNVVPVGELNLIRGRLDLLGNRFTLSEGSASLRGGFIPVLRLVATTETDGITASIVIEGPATEPDINFISTPELPEDEVVARILFGRGLETLSPFQAAQLASAVATLSGRGGEGIVGSLREGIGLDDLDVYTDEEGGAGVRAGAYVTENLYTDVTVDSEGRSEVSINLDVSRSVTVRGRTDSEGRTGIGLFFERDY